MAAHMYAKRTRIRVPAGVLYRWHAEPDALERLTPPGVRMKIVSRSGNGLEDGARVEFRFGLLRRLWVAEHRDNIPGRQFRDVQIRGPFRRWIHTHRFLADGPDACYLLDEVVYELPFGQLGERLAGNFVLQKIERLFAWRHEVTRRTFEGDSSKPLPPV